MKNGTLVLSFLFLLTLIGCNGSSGPSSVTVHNDGVFEPISYTIDGNPISDGGLFDLDEYENDSGPRVITVLVKNNTAYPMTNMDVVFNDTSKVEYTFEKDDVGDANYPGWTGTCTDTLNPGQDCTITLAFETTISGVYTQSITFKFKNLIEKDNRTSEFKVLAGYPASLVYGVKEDQADPGVEISPVIYGAQNFFFGEEVGPAKIPVVERTDNIEYKMVLSIKNEGELRARTIQFNPSQTCSSKATGVCPGVAHTSTHTFEHNCPTVLYSGESCDLTIRFTPANQDPLPAPDEVRYIQYIANSIFNYVDSPLLTPAVLNGYFITHSTEIRGIFETAIENLDFVDTLIVGNRQKKAFKVNNNGFRHGVFKAFHFINNADSSHMASCIAESGTNILKCYDQTLTTPKSLEEFPFFVDDTQNCFSDGGETTYYMDVGTGCVFHLYFQPSIQYTTAKNFDFSMQVEYDSRWKNAEFIIPDEHLQTTISDSKPAAKMNIIKMKLGEIEYTDKEFDFSDITTSVSTFNMGRIALMNQFYYVRQTLTITLQNDGGADAINNTFVDGQSVTIPFTSDNADGVDIGPNAPVYYEGVVVNNSQCEVVMPGSTCIITMEFAPIGNANPNGDQKDLDNMFDYQDVNPSNNLKKFIMNYDDGALYSDTNLTTTTRDIPQRTAETQLKAILVKKGYLKAFHDYDPGWENIDIIHGNMEEHTQTLHNIGTGSIPYIIWSGMTPAERYRDSFEFVPTADPSAFGATKDCYELIDWNTTTHTVNKHDNTRFFQDEDLTDVATETPALSGNWVPNRIIDTTGLPAGEKCAISYKYKETNFWKINDSFFGSGFKPLKPETSEINRVIDFDYVGDDRIEWRNFIADSRPNFSFAYYDGDATDPGIDPSDDISLAFGNLTESCREQNTSPYCLAHHLRDKGMWIKAKRPAEIVVKSPQPLMSAVIRRGSMVVPPHDIDPAYLALNEFDPVDKPDEHADWQLANMETLPGSGIPDNRYSHDGCLGFTLPNKCGGFTIPEVWVYGVQNSTEDDPIFSTTLKSFSSITHAPGAVATVDALAGMDVSQYEYILHAGSFHANQNQNIRLTLSNVGGGGAQIFDFVENEITEAGLDTNAFTYTSPFNAEAPGEMPNPGNEDSWQHIPGNDSSTILQGVPLPFTYRFNATQPGIYKMELTIHYYDGRFVDKISGAKISKDKKILVIAEVIDDAPKIQFTYQDYKVEVQPTGQPNVGANPEPAVYYPKTFYNEGTPAATDYTIFSGVKIDNMPACYPKFDDCTEDFYIRRRIIMKNTSATKKMYNLQVYFKDSYTALSTSSPDATNDVYIDYSDCSNADAPLNSPTEHSREGDGVASLDEAGGTKDSCHIEVFYQPTVASTSFEAQLFVRYETQPNQYVQQFVALDFIAKDPAVVNIAGKDAKSINIGGGNVENSYPLNFGQVQMTTEPQEIAFNQAAGMFGVQEVVNPNPNTKASFLKTYHDFLVEHEVNGFNAGNTPPIEYYPPAGDFYDDGGYDVVDLFRVLYPDTTTKLNVAATEACFVGDDGLPDHTQISLGGWDPSTNSPDIGATSPTPGNYYIATQAGTTNLNGINTWSAGDWAYYGDSGWEKRTGELAHFERGFLQTTAQKCYFVVRLNADINYIGNQLTPIDVNDMLGNFHRIWYYNNDRSSTAYLTIHFEGMVTPNPSFKQQITVPGEDHFDVTATRSGQIAFSWDPMLEDEPTIGSISGYRVYISESASALFDPTLAVGLDFVDTSGTSIVFSDGIIPGKFYFFKIVPIRDNPNYTADAFDQLGAGKFLSLSDSTTLQVVTPPNNMEYNHDLNVLVDRDLSLLVLKNYSEAISVCQGKPSLFLDKGGAVQPFGYDLINEPIWDWIESDITLSNYSNVYQTSHWVKTPFYYNIDIEFAAIVGFDSAQSSQLFSAEKMFYLRDPDIPTNTVPMAKGGVIGTSETNFTSFVGETIPFGMPRCYVPLP